MVTVALLVAESEPFGVTPHSNDVIASNAFASMVFKLILYLAETDIINV